MKYRHRFRRYLIAGVLVWLPLWTTFVIIKFLVDLFDGILGYLPRRYQPDQLLGFHVPGLGVLFSILVVVLTGLLVTNILGSKLIHLWEAVLDRIPLVRTIYKAVKQLLETLLSSGSQSFRKVLLVEYPRKGMWSLAFQTAAGQEKLSPQTDMEMVVIFIPTTPNPTSGFLMIVPIEDVIEIDMSIDEAIKLIISLGVVQPSLPKDETLAPKLS